MTTFSVHFELSGEEIPIYRCMLEKWSSRKLEEFQNVQGENEWVLRSMKKDQQKVDQLIQRTYDINGGNAVKVKEGLDLHFIRPFWGVIKEEQDRLMATLSTRRELPKEERVIFLSKFADQMSILNSVSSKIKNYGMSSRFC